MASGSKVWTRVSGSPRRWAPPWRHARRSTATWKLATGKNPPSNPADPDVDMLGGRDLGGRQRRRRRAGPDARQPQGRRLLPPLDRAPAARTCEDVEV